MFYEFVRGPMMWIAFVLFLCGILYQGRKLSKLVSVRRGLQAPPAPPLPARSRASTTDGRSLALRLALAKESLVGKYPALTLVSVVFHALVLVVPLFLTAHNVLLDQSWGFDLYSFRESVSDAFTVVVLGCCLFFFLRRLLAPRVRAISTFGDFFILFLVAMPFLTGFLAYHQLFAYEIVLVSHILAGELMLVAIPFTKLFHMIMFFVNRIY